MPQKVADSVIKSESRIQLTLQAFKNGQFKSIRAAATAYDVSYRTLTYRINGRKSRADISVNCQKLSDLEETSLKKWILNIDERGLPPTHAIIHKMADLLLSQRKSGLTTGKN
jgi:hypothetical protein